MTLPIWNRIIQKLSWFCVMFYEPYIYFILNKLQYKLEYKLRLWLLSHSYLNIMWTSWSFLSKGTSKPSNFLLMNSAITLFPSGHPLSSVANRLSYFDEQGREITSNYMTLLGATVGPPLSTPLSLFLSVPLCSFPFALSSLLLRTRPDHRPCRYHLHCSSTSRERWQMLKTNFVCVCARHM